MVSFADLTVRLHLINDLILSDMICDQDMNETAAEAMIFSKHVLTTKHWFGRISYTNKKRYLLTLLHDIRSAWTLSLLLKSIWNCRPKDAVLSVSEHGRWLSSYDQAPIDHNRTVQPEGALKQTMKNDRFWFASLEPESQALVLSELLTVAGGPVMWEVLRRAQTLYNNYSTQLVQNIVECIPVLEIKADPMQTAATQFSGMFESSSAQLRPPNQPPTQGEKDLETNLAAWNSTIKSLRDSLKLEEYEVTFVDGTKKKIWKVNRPKPDVLETVDFVQLLPSSIAKKILSYVPQTQYADLARVNKYWSYLIEEYRAEIVVRTKINMELERLNDIIMKFDTSFDDIGLTNDLQLPTSDHGAMTSTVVGPTQPAKTAPSIKASEKSGGGFSLRYFSDKLTKPAVAQKPIRNMKDFTERLDTRGAIDDNIWKWCENITSQHKNKAVRIVKKDKVTFMKKKGTTEKKEEEPIVKIKTGIIQSTSLDNVYFPCPLMQKSVEVPLDPPLYRDPAKTTSAVHKLKKKMSDPGLLHLPTQNTKRYCLWTRDVSTLYPVSKIPSHQFPDN